MTELTVFENLFQDGLPDREFEPFREGVEIFWLATGEPDVALLRYSLGAKGPYHRHVGTETILVLSGSQSDERGDYPKGTFIVNAAGTEHSVWSEEGCIVLVQWQRPVEFIDTPIAKS